MRSCHCLWEANSRLQHASHVCKQSLCKDWASGAATSRALCSFALSLSSVSPRLQGQGCGVVVYWWLYYYVKYSLPLYQSLGVHIMPVSHCTHSRLKHASTHLLLICNCIMIVQSHINECKTCHLGFRFALQSSSNASDSTST